MLSSKSIIVSREIIAAAVGASVLIAVVGNWPDPILTLKLDVPLFI